MDRRRFIRGMLAGVAGLVFPFPKVTKDPTRFSFGSCGVLASTHGDNLSLFAKCYADSFEKHVLPQMEAEYKLSKNFVSKCPAVWSREIKVDPINYFRCDL